MLRFGSHRFGSNRATHLKSPKKGSVFDFWISATQSWRNWAIGSCPLATCKSNVSHINQPKSISACHSIRKYGISTDYSNIACKWISCFETNISFWHATQEADISSCIPLTLKLCSAQTNTELGVTQQESCSSGPSSISKKLCSASGSFGQIQKEFTSEKNMAEMGHLYDMFLWFKCSKFYKRNLLNVLFPETEYPRHMAV